MDYRIQKSGGGPKWLLEDNQYLAQAILRLALLPLLGALVHYTYPTTDRQGGPMHETESSDSLSELPTIPERALLLHIGVFKTGTTALQTTLRRSREILDSNGVLYRGPNSWKVVPLRMLLDEDGAPWAKLEDAVHSASGRVIVSSENMCLFTDAQAHQAVRRLGAGRDVRVLITVRSLAEMLPSTWQQELRNRPKLTGSYEEWLRTTVPDPDGFGSKFWQCNNFPRLLNRWGGIVGEENVSFVITDKRQPDRILRATEQLLGLTPDVLEFHPSGRINRSRSFEEAELMYRINLATEKTLTHARYLELVKAGVFRTLLTRPEASGTAIPVPAWAANEMADIGRQHAKLLQDSRASILGDINDIAQTKTLVSDSVTPPSAVSMDVAVAAVVGAINAADRELENARQSLEPPEPPKPSQPPEVARHSSFRKFLGRLKSRFRRRD